MDFGKLFRNIPKDFGSNLTKKIGTPPKLKTRKCFCMWSDLLGFGNIFVQNNWKIDDKAQREIYNRLEAAHSAVLYYSSFLERNLILNDGIAKVFHPRSKFEDKNNVLSISLFFRSCVELHLSISKTEHEHNYPGCRSILAFGENIEYLADEIRLDDYVMNYSKPQGAELSDLAQKLGNPVVIYNPKELQMNTAFSKAFLLDEGGNKAGLPGNNFYVDESVINAVIEYSEYNGYSPILEKTNEGLFLFLPYKDNNPHEVVVGFCFDSEIIVPQGIKYDTKVYKLKRFYPHDEKTEDFFFDLVKNS